MHYLFVFHLSSSKDFTEDLDISTVTVAQYAEREEGENQSHIHS